MYSTELCNTIIFYADAKDWYNINEGDMPPCQKMPCRNDGVCIPHENNLHDYTCNCTAGFSGKNCETHIACESENCNGGECIPKASNPLDFVCLCPFGRVGVQCQTGGYAVGPWIKTVDHFDYYMPSFSNCFIQTRKKLYHFICNVKLSTLSIVRFHCKLM